MLNGIYLPDFDKNAVIEKIGNLEVQLEEEMAKEPEKRDRKREFELIYARFIAGLKLNTGYRN